MCLRRSPLGLCHDGVWFAVPCAACMYVAVGATRLPGTASCPWLQAVACMAPGTFFASCCTEKVGLKMSSNLLRNALGVCLRAAAEHAVNNNVVARACSCWVTLYNFGTRWLGWSGGCCRCSTVFHDAQPVSGRPCRPWRSGAACCVCCQTPASSCNRMSLCARCAAVCSSAMKLLQRPACQLVDMVRACHVVCHHKQLGMHTPPVVCWPCWQKEVLLQLCRCRAKHCVCPGGFDTLAVGDDRWTCVPVVCMYRPQSLSVNAQCGAAGRGVVACSWNACTPQCV
jgi:hypothetical protein